jgi:hypothetical protein
MPKNARWSSKFEIKPGSWVFVPTDETVKYGQKIKKAIEDRWSPPGFYYHLRDGGHVQALSSHTNNDFFIHLDISNFFGRINKSRVTRCLKGVFSYNQAREIAVESTVRDPNDPGVGKYILPFGFVQSPLIASLCLQQSRLGRFLSDLNNMGAYKVSVYMDDIVISSNSDTGLSNVLREVKPIAEKSGFPLNEAKEEGPAEKITAFNIELSNGVLTLTEERLKDFIAAYRESDNFNVISGIFGYVMTVNKGQAEKIV